MNQPPLAVQLARLNHYLTNAFLYVDEPGDSCKTHLQRARELLDQIREDY